MQQRVGGIWELFIPGLEEGHLYKYEIRTQEGHCYQKADPYGFQHEVRPDNSSVVARLGGYQWSDQGWICLLYTSPSPRDLSTSRMPSSA